MGHKSLILVGGLSLRMGSPKYALIMPSDDTLEGDNLLLRLIQCHHDFRLDAYGEVSTEITISVRSNEQRCEVESLLATYRLPDKVTIEFVTDEQTDAGPASGLLAAHHLDRDSSWMVSGCDYPLLESEALKQLSAEHMQHCATVTCFMNEERFSEPLLAIWSSAALRTLEVMMHEAKDKGRRLGPNQVIRALQKDQSSQSSSTSIKLVKPSKPVWLRNANTPQDWAEVQRLLVRPDAR